MRTYLRFYEELNDFLPSSWRKTTFAFGVNGRKSVRQILESLDVPASAVDLVLADGRSVGLSHLVKNNERMSFYPVFERFDISPLQRVRSRPLRRTRFMVLSDLKVLAQYLRLLGFDVVVGDGAQKGDPSTAQSSDGRIVLTRNRKLPGGAGIPRALLLRSSKPALQLVQILDSLDLWRSTKYFTRCIYCNRASKGLKAGGIPIHSKKSLDVGLSCCPACTDIHWDLMRARRIHSLVRRIFKRGIAPAWHHDRKNIRSSI